MDVSEIKGLNGMDGGITISLSDIEGMKGMHRANMMFLDSDGDGEKHVKIIQGDHMELMGDGSHGQVFIKQTKKSGDGDDIEVEVDSNFFVTGDGPHASVMLEAAQNLLKQAENMQSDQPISDKARRKIEKARKALAEAQEALEEE